MTDFFWTAALVVATTFELLPERLDLSELVLTASGLGALFGAFGAVLSGGGSEGRARRAEKGALFGAGAALGAFVVLYLAQEVR
jgi:hypothetical protein